MSTYADDQRLQQHDTARDVGRIVRMVILIAVVAAIVAVAVDNRHDVRFGYVVGDATIPIWLLVIASAVGGVVVGWLVKHRRRHDS